MSLLTKQHRMVLERASELGPIDLENNQIWEALKGCRDASQQALSRMQYHSGAPDLDLCRALQGNAFAACVQALLLMEAFERMADDLEAGAPVRRSPEGEDA